MAFNRGKSILGTGDDVAQVEAESDLIFAATFIGTAIWYNLGHCDKPWTIGMEPERDVPQESDRTDSDRTSMKAHNDACSRVNRVVKGAAAKKDDVIASRGVAWGLTPMFARGDAICAGGNAASVYPTWDKALAEGAYKVLTDTNTPVASPQVGQAPRQQEHSMYIGRGAYCGLVATRAMVGEKEEIQAIVAMSTLRSTLTQDTEGVGNRWVPPKDAPVRAAKYPEPKDKSFKVGEATWGVIASNGLQVKLQAQGMQFLPADENLAAVSYDNTVGYTHGMIRCLYEKERIGEGEVYEMSIGTGTFKLASCLSCSLFMFAQGAGASWSHLGAGESWAPYYPQVATHNAHNHSYLPDNGDMTLARAITVCNGRYAAHMDHWMKLGLWALDKVGMDKCLATKGHKDAFTALAAKVGFTPSTKEKAAVQPKLQGRVDGTVARDFYLDAMTFHKKDVLRLNSALLFDKTKDSTFVEDAWDWYQHKAVNRTWDTWETDISDEDVATLIAPPDPLTKAKYNIVVSRRSKEVGYPKATLVQKFSDKPGTEIRIDDTTGKATFEVVGNPTYWQIKWSTERDPHSINPDPSTSVNLAGSGNFTYTVTKA